MVTCFFTTSRPGGEVDLLRFMVRRPSQNDGARTHAQDFTKMLYVFSAHGPILQE